MEHNRVEPSRREQTTRSNDVIVTSPVESLFPFFLSFSPPLVCIFHEQILTFKAWQEIRRVQKFGTVLKTNERRNGQGKKIRSTFRTCVYVDVTGIFFLFLLVVWNFLIFPPVVNIIICWWCVHMCRKSGSWEIRVPKPKCDRWERHGETLRKAGDALRSECGIGMQIGRRHHPHRFLFFLFPRQRKSKTSTTQSPGDFFSGCFPPVAIVREIKQKNSKQFPANNIDHNLFVPIDFFHVIFLFNFPGCSWRIGMMMHAASSATPQNVFIFLGCRCFLPSKQSNNIIPELLHCPSRKKKKSHHQHHRHTDPSRMIPSDTRNRHQS